MEEENFSFSKQADIYLVTNSWKKYSLDDGKFIQTNISIENLIFLKVALNKNFGCERLYALIKNNKKYELFYLNEEQKFSSCFSFDFEKTIDKIYIIDGPTIVFQSLDELFIIKNSKIQNIPQMKIIFTKEDYFLVNSIKKNEILKIKMQNEQLEIVKFNQFSYIYSKNSCSIVSSFGQNEFFIVTNLRQLIHFKNGKIMKIKNLEKMPKEIKYFQFGLNDSYVSVHFIDSSIQIFSLENWEVLKTIEDISFQLVDDFISNGQKQLVLISNENVILFKEKIKLEINENRHLYSVSRALESRNEAGHQLIYQIENTIDQKKKLIKNQEVIISNLQNRKLSQNDISSEGIFFNLKNSKNGQSTHSKKYFSLNFEKLKKSKNMNDIKPFDSIFDFNQNNTILDLKFKYFDKLNDQNYVAFSDEMILKSKLFFKQGEITNVVLNTETPILYSNDEYIVNYACLSNKPTFIGAIHPSTEEKLFSVHSKMEKDSCQLYEIKLLLKSNEIDFSIFEFLSVLFMEMNLNKINEGEFELQKNDLYLYSRFSKIQSETFCSLKSNNSKKLILFLKSFLKNIPNYVSALPSPFSKENLDRIQNCYQNLSQEIYFVLNYFKNKESILEDYFNLQSNTDESMELMLGYSPTSNFNYPYF
eukprot:gene5773-9594_t